MFILQWFLINLAIDREFTTVTGRSCCGNVYKNQRMSDSVKIFGHDYSCLVLVTGDSTGRQFTVSKLFKDL